LLKIFKRQALTLYCLLSFFYSYPTLSQNFDPRLVEAYNSTLDLKIRRDLPVLHSEKFQSTENQAFQIYINNLSKTLDLLIVKDKNKYKAYFKDERKHYQILETLNKDHPFVNHLKIELKVQRGLLKIRYGDRISGAFNLIQAFRKIRINDKIPKGKAYTLKTIGLLNVILSLFPDQYSWILNMFRVKPDITKGINYLRELAESSSIFNKEGILLYALSQTFYGNNSAGAVDILSDDKEKFDNSLLYRYLYGLASIKNRDNLIAVQYLDSCLYFDRNYLQIPLINYYRAESYLKAQNYNKAGYLYNLYLQNPDDDEFIKDSNYKLFNLAVLFGIPDQNVEFYKNNVLTKGSLFTGSDKYAYYRIHNNYTPDYTLFISRILFDGGHYERSLDVLKSHRLSAYSAIEEISEYLYRFARNYQHLDKRDLAIEYFNEVINTKGAEQYYFWGNSLLNLGIMYTRSENYVKAREFYQKALLYKGDEYKNSIRMEAKNGLKKIEKY